MSIKRQLTSLIISTIILASFFAALHGFRNSKLALDLIFDQELASIANVISAVVINNEKVPENIEGNFVFQVFKDNVLHTKNTNTPSEPIITIEEGFNDTVFSGKRWRTFTLLKNGYSTIVAQPIDARIASVESVLYGTIMPIVVSIPLIALLVYYIIYKSLFSLNQLSNQIKRKSTSDLSKVVINNPPAELAPVITRLNLLLARVKDSFEREKQLTANAAHELRTPVSVLAITAHNISEDFAANTLHNDSIIELTQNVERMAHVIEQMIALFRFSPEQFNMNKHSVNVQQVLQDVVSNNYDDIEAKSQQVSLESNNSSVLGDTFALYTMFENILKNAIKYSGKDSRIDIKHTSSNKIVTVSIEDSGEGVNPVDYKHIFERFYRVNTHKNKDTKQGQGAGLGLSIVSHIMALHEGNVVCEKSLLGGLCIRVSLPELQVQTLS